MVIIKCVNVLLNGRSLSEYLGISQSALILKVNLELKTFFIKSNCTEKSLLMLAFDNILKVYAKISTKHSSLCIKMKQVCSYNYELEDLHDKSHHSVKIVLNCSAEKLREYVILLKPHLHSLWLVEHLASSSSNSCSTPESSTNASDRQSIVLDVSIEQLKKRLTENVTIMYLEERAEMVKRNMLSPIEEERSDEISSTKTSSSKFIEMSDVVKASGENTSEIAAVDSYEQFFEDLVLCQSRATLQSTPQRNSKDSTDQDVNLCMEAAEEICVERSAVDQQNNYDLNEMITSKYFPAITPDIHFIPALKELAPTEIAMNTTPPELEICPLDEERILSDAAFEQEKSWFLDRTGDTNCSFLYLDRTKTPTNLNTSDYFRRMQQSPGYLMWSERMRKEGRIRKPEVEKKEEEPKPYSGAEWIGLGVEQFIKKHNEMMELEADQKLTNAQRKRKEKRKRAETKRLQKAKKAKKAKKRPPPKSYPSYLDESIHEQLIIELEVKKKPEYDVWSIHEGSSLIELSPQSYERLEILKAKYEQLKRQAATEEQQPQNIEPNETVGLSPIRPATPEGHIRRISTDLESEKSRTPSIVEEHFETDEYQESLNSIHYRPPTPEEFFVPTFRVTTPTEIQVHREANSQ